MTSRMRTTISWAIVTFCGAVQAVAGRFYVNPDGVAYLNMSDAYTRGDWAAAANTYWSPLYPLMIGFIRRLHAWPMYWESSIVHGINFAIYLASYACFGFMLHELALYQRQKQETEPAAYVVDWSQGWEFVLAHVLFLWSALLLIGLANVTPDMMIAAEVYLVAGLMVRIRRGRRRMLNSILLGLALGVSYLTKAVMFPVALVLIGFTGWRPGTGRWSRLERLACALTFFAVALPQLIQMSREVGRPSFGENGRIAYAKYVNLYDGYWTGTSAAGKPVHPMRQVLSNPPVYEFGTNDRSSSYPYWDKPRYWLQGIRPHFNLSQQIVATQRELGTYAASFATLFLGALILLLMRLSRARIDLLGICVVAASVLVIYALIHVEDRLAAPWAVLLFVALVSSSAFRGDTSSRAGVRAVFTALAVWYFALTASAIRHSTVDAGRALAGSGEPHEYWTVAVALEKLGLQRGDRVASIGRSSESYWARLAGVQISLEIPPHVSNRYWILDSAARSKVHKVLVDHGARMVVASYPPAGGGPGWIRLGSSAFYGLPLSPLPTVGNRP